MTATHTRLTSPPRTRDRTAEIDAAISAVIDRAGPVSLAAGDSGPLTVRFLYADEAAHVPAGSSSLLPFTGAPGELRADADVLLVGLGRRADDVASASAIETARAAATAAGAQLPGGDVAVDLTSVSPELVPALVDGLATECTAGDPVRLVVDPSLLPAAERGSLAADVSRLARLLVSAPANLLTPERAARWAQDIAERAGLEGSVHGPEEIEAEGFGGLAAIGAGAVNGPRLVRLAYSADAGGPHVALVGKGITFDSGGLSLKSPAAMQSMRLDVAGAATVLAVMAGLKRARCAINVHAVLPLAENMPGPSASRPGDVITAWNGTQIQLLDLDFEGRVVLADALALAATENPELLIDLATLTYQAEIALGPEIAALVGRDDAAVQRMLKAAASAGEPMWQLPWAERYADQVRTPFGVRNHPLRDTGRALTAALFLGEFVPSEVPWVHCDMTGPAWRGDASADGATGFGARTLLTLLNCV